MALQRKQRRRINRLSQRGLTRNEILDRLNGANNQRDLTRAQLSYIGFRDQRVDRILRNQRQGRATWSAGTTSTKDRSGYMSRPSTGGGGTSVPGGGIATGDGDELLVDEFNQSAFDMMRGILGEYGLESLSDRLRDLVQGGITDPATITLELQDTDEWKQRFNGNEKLKAAGLPVLSVAEYLATERSMAQVMKNYGLPEGFYDSPEDFGKFIGNAVSPQELQDRVKSYADLASREDPAVKAQLRAMGMNEGDLLAFMMDPERANPLIQRKYKSTLIGAAARRSGLVASNDYADYLAGRGVTEEQAQAGYSMISEGLPTLEKLGDIYGQEYGQSDFESEVFDGDGKAARKRKRLASQERAAFSGSSGVGQGSLRQSSAGQF